MIIPLLVFFMLLVVTVFFIVLSSKDNRKIYMIYKFIFILNKFILYKYI